MSNTAKKPKKVEAGTLYLPDDTLHTITPRNSKVFTLAELQEYVGGYIETIICAERYARGYVNEDAYALQLKPNPFTWDVVKQSTYVLNGYTSAWRILGPIVVVRKVEVAQ